MRSVPVFLTLILLALAPTPGLRAEEGGEAAEAAAPPAEPVHRALEQTTVGFYAVYLPADYEADASREKRYPLCVILHGSGSTETGHGALANGFGREGVIYLAPRAPYPHHGVFLEGHKPGWTAWPEWPESWGEPGSATFPTSEVEKLDVPRLYVDWIADCIRDVARHYRVDDQRVVVVGHSQGAAFAHQLAIRHPELVRSYFAYAGYYEDTLHDPEKGDDATARVLKEKKIHPFIAHCEGDEVVDVAQTRELLAYYEAHEIPHEALVVPGGSHGIVSKVRRAMHAFVARECRHEELPPLKGELVVTEVVAGSQGAAVGLAPGDVITAYGDVPMTCIDDLRAAIEGLPPDATEVVLRWRRDGEVHQATVERGTIGIQLTDR